MKIVSLFLGLLLSCLNSLSASMTEEEYKKETSVKSPISDEELRKHQSSYILNARKFLVESFGDSYLDELIEFKDEKNFGKIRVSDSFDIFEKVFSKNSSEKGVQLMTKSGKLFVKEEAQAIPMLSIRRYDKDDPLNIKIHIQDLFRGKIKEEAEKFFLIQDSRIMEYYKPL